MQMYRFIVLNIS